MGEFPPQEIAAFPATAPSKLKGILLRKNNAVFGVGNSKVVSVHTELEHTPKATNLYKQAIPKSGFRISLIANALIVWVCDIGCYPRGALAGIYGG